MKITRENYFKEYEKLDKSNIPETLSKGYKLIVGASENNWVEYTSNDNIKRVVDMYFKTLGEYIKSLPKKRTANKQESTSKPTQKKASENDVVYVFFRNKDKGFKEDKKFFSGKNAYQRAVRWAKNEFEKFDPDFIHYSDEEEMNAYKKTQHASSKTKGSRRTENSTAKMKVIADPTADKVEVISDELKFIRRYVNMHDKPKTRNQIRLFVNAVQRSIRERRIRKTSPYAKEIILVQDELIKLHAAFKNDKQEITVDIAEKTRVKFFNAIGKEVEFLSVKLIKSYIGLQGRIVENLKASRLLKRIESAISKKRITKRDAYWSEIEQILSNLKSFVKKNPNHGVLQIEERTLNGLQGIVDCSCSTSEVINGLPERLDVDKLTDQYFLNKKQGDDRFLMNSKAYSNINFETLGFFGKWLQLFGDPELGFSAVIMGSPKMGKSTLAIEFSGDMAKDFGKVLYVAREEGKSETFKRKLDEATATHNNLYVSNYIPVNVGDFRFVILDSVTKMGLTSRNLEALNKTFHQTSFLGVHQVTKDGKARGTNEFIHDADVIINVYAPGMARSRGRFNEGGELDFFNDAATAA